MAIEFIRPKDLPAAAGVNPNDDLIVDSGASVGRATPREIVDAARPVATEPQAVAGTDNDVAMTPLTTAQAIAADGAGIKSDAQAALQGAQTAQGLAEGARDSAQGYASAAGGFASDAAGSASGASSSASAALVSEGNAASSESAASQAASAAVTAQGLAEDWAESPTAPDAPGTKSSKTWAGEAAQSATEAATFNPELYLTKENNLADLTDAEAARGNLGLSGAVLSDVLINGDFRINQRGFDGNWAGLSAGEYGYDRWKKEDASTITQVVEEGNFTPSATYTLFGAGIATQQLVSPASGHWPITVPDSASDMRLVFGDKATAYPRRFKGVEQALCERYYETGSYAETLGVSNASIVTNFQTNVNWRTLKRAIPSVSGTNNQGAFTAESIGRTGASIGRSSTVAARENSGTYIADAEL